MIQLTRLNGHSMAVNSDLIKFVEQAPDTVITLITGEKVVVKESTIDVMARILEFRRAVLAAATAKLCASIQQQRLSGTFEVAGTGRVSG